MSRTGRALLWPILLGLLLTFLPATAAARYFCFGHSATIVGTPGEDHLEGTPGRDVIVALKGIDGVEGRGGDDLICLGPGGRSNDLESARGGRGQDRIAGGSGVDHLTGTEGADRLEGGADTDTIFGNKGDDLLLGGGARDVIWGLAGDDVIRGQRGSDILRGQQGDDRIIGGTAGPGGDLVDYLGVRFGVEVNLSQGRSKGQGRDRLFGIEHVVGSNGTDTLIGDHEDNILSGLFGVDVLRGRAGRDCLSPGGDGNRLYGGRGFDFYSANVPQNTRRFDCTKNSDTGSIGGTTSGVTVDLAAGTASGMNGNSNLWGIEGVFGSYLRDDLRGDRGENYLYGGPSADMIEGRRGDDLLDGAGNYDRLDGGNGTDRCLNGEAVLSCE